MKRTILQKLLALALAVALAAVLLPGGTPARATVHHSGEDATYDGYLVVLRDAPAGSVRAAAAPAVTLAPVVPSAGIYYADTPGEAAAYVNAGMVEGIYPNYRVELADTPNDPGYAATISGYRQTYLNTVGMPEVWAQYPGLTGAGVRVAVIDSGVYKDHPDFLRDGVSCVVDGKNYTGDGLTGYDDIVGHGTAVAGIIAAVTGNGLGIASMAPGVSIVSLKAFYIDEEHKATSKIGDVLVALYDAVDVYDCDVINMSFRFKTSNNMPYRPLTNAVEYAAAKGALLVAAAGNDGGITTVGPSGVAEQLCPSYPAADAIVVSVGALAGNGTVASQSQRHMSTDISAPGISILSTLYTRATQTAGYAAQSGTSLATPMVAAAAALLKQLDPGITQTQFQLLLRQRAAPFTGGGVYDIYGGAGVLSLPALLQKQGVIAATPSPDGGQTVQAYLWQMDISGAHRVFVAGYDADNRMVAVQTAPVTVSDHGALAVEVTLPSSAVTTVKFILCDDSLAPIVQLTQE